MNTQLAMNSLMGFPATYSTKKRAKAETARKINGGSTKTKYPCCRRIEISSGTRYRVEIQANKMKHNLGTFKTIDEAGAAIEAFGQKHNLDKYKVLSKPGTEDHLAEYSQLRSVTIKGITETREKACRRHGTPFPTASTRVSRNNDSWEEAITAKIDRRFSSKSRKGLKA